MWLRSSLALCFLLFLVPVAHAADLVELESRCAATIAELDAQIRAAKLWRGALTVVAAIVTAAGSVVAGFAKRAAVRKSSAIVGALSGVLTAILGLLPSSDALQAQKNNAEKHMMLGDKVASLPDFSNDETSQSYVATRYRECASAQARPKVPRLTKRAIELEGEYDDCSAVNGIRPINGQCPREMHQDICGRCVAD